MALDQGESFSGSSTCTDPSASKTPYRPNHVGALEVVAKGDDDRESLERFIGARFAAAYGAQVTHFSRHLVGLRDASRGWHASAGYSPARDGALFLESYLAEPIERILTQRCRGPVVRERIVEVGNLAATSAGMGRELMAATVRHLHDAGYGWVVFTATRELRNMFTRLGVPLIAVATADPARLPDRGASWGRYYAHDPQVMATDLAAAVRVGRPR